MPLETFDPAFGAALLIPHAPGHLFIGVDNKHRREA